VALASCAAASGGLGLADEGPWVRAEHERLATTMLERLGVEVRQACPVEPAFVDHFGTPVCGYVTLDFHTVAALLVAELDELDRVEVRRVHASGVEAYLDLRVDGRQHLVDYTLVPNRRGEHLLVWYVPDLASASPTWEAASAGVWGAPVRSLAPPS
jgi:hypothetical protein